MCPLNCCIRSALSSGYICGVQHPVCVQQNQSSVQRVFRSNCTSLTELVQNFKNIFPDTSPSWDVVFLQSRLLPAKIWVSSTCSIKKGCPATAQESACFVPASSIVGTFAAAQACDSWEPANCSCVSDMSLGKNKNSWESPAFWETRDTVSACQSCDCVSERHYRFTLAWCVVFVPACFHGHGKPLLKAEPCGSHGVWWQCLGCPVLPQWHLQRQLVWLQRPATGCRRWMEHALAAKGHGVVFGLKERGTECGNFQRMSLPVCWREEEGKAGFLCCSNAWAPLVLIKKVMWNKTGEMWAQCNVGLCAGYPKKDTWRSGCWGEGWFRDRSSELLLPR